MGTILWSILALIFILLLTLPSTSREDDGDNYCEQLFAAHGRGGRCEYDDVPGNCWAGRGCNCSENGSSGDLKWMLEAGFITRINASIQSVNQQCTGPLLVHTGTSDGDVLLYSKGDSELNSMCIRAPLYQSLKIFSHLPVEAAAIALGNRTNSSDIIQDLRHHLSKAKSLLDSNFTQDQIIINTQKKILRMVNESLDNDILESLGKANFNEYFMQNAQDGVRDYLKQLNKIIESLNVSSNCTTIVIYHRQFAYPESFIVQYYKLRFNYNVRIILRPKDEYCLSDGNSSTLVTSDAASTVNFERHINATFDRFRPNASIHDYLDAQTERIICRDLQFKFESCPKSDQSLPGFETRIEKAYVVLFVFFGACSVMLGIVLLTICYEDRVLKAEGKALSSYKLLNGRERPLSVSMQSNEED